MMKMPWEDDINWGNTATTIVKGDSMSILIKDIDLPKDDKPLNLEIYSDGHIWINWGPEYERKDNVAIQIDNYEGERKLNEVG